MIPDNFIANSIIIHKSKCEGAAHLRYYVCRSCKSRWLDSAPKNEQDKERYAANVFKTRIRHKEGCKAYNLYQRNTDAHKRTEGR